jgi:hypothetical protein
MKYVLALLLILSPSLSTAADLDPAVLLELAKAKRIRESASVSPATPKKTTCGCGLTGLCTCYVGECQCSACGFGGAAKQAGKSDGSTAASTARIPAPSAGTPVQPVKERGSSAEATETEPTPTAAPYVLTPFGGTSNCPNGNCPTATTQRRGLIFRR